MGCSHFLTAMDNIAATYHVDVVYVDICLQFFSLQMRTTLNLETSRLVACALKVAFNGVCLAWLVRLSPVPTFSHRSNPYYEPVSEAQKIGLY